MAEDYYELLGVSREASQDEILKAYRKVARKLHPDVNPGDKTATQKFQRVQAAFETLKDPEKRKLYDRFGENYEKVAAGGAGPGAGAAGGYPGGGGSWSRGAGGRAGGAEFDINDLFSQFGSRGGPFSDYFRQGRPSGGSEAPAGGRDEDSGDIHLEVKIPFTLAVKGGTVDLEVPRRTSRTGKVALKIPPGVEDGTKMRLRAQGEFAGGGLTPGDLIVTIQVETHKWFTRRDNDLIVRVPVTLAEAALGAMVDVPTPGGTITLRIPAGTSSGAKLRVKGQGITKENGVKGDLFAEIQIRIPQDLDDEAREAIQKLDAKYPLKPRQDLQW